MKATSAGERGAAAGVADARERKLLQRCGIVSGCLSFPSDATQGELLDLYQDTLDRTLGDEFLGSDGAWPPTRSRGVQRAADDRTAHQPRQLCGEGARPRI